MQLSNSTAIEKKLIDLTGDTNAGKETRLLYP